MKRFFMLSLVVLLTLAYTSARASGPIDQGSWIIDGNVGLNASLSGGGGTTIYLQPSAMMFIQQRLALGGDFILNAGGGTTTFGLVPTVAYFFGDTRGKGFPFIRGGLGFSSTSNGSGTSFTSVDIMFGGGYALLISKEVFLNFSGTMNIYTADASGTILNLNGGVGVFLY